MSGPNGSGESTQLRLLGRHLPAGSGRMRFGGRPIGPWTGAIYDGVGFYAAAWWVGIACGLGQVALIGALLMRQRGGMQLSRAAA